MGLIFLRTVTHFAQRLENVLTQVTLIHSLMSGKKKTIFNGELINEAQKVSKEWVFAWSFGAHLLRVGINFEEYGLVIDGIPFKK